MKLRKVLIFTLIILLISIILSNSIATYGQISSNSYLSLFEKAFKSVYMLN